MINAVTHRDYFEKGANVMVEMFDDRIEITNPGGLVKGLRPEDLGKKSVLRNPNIAALLHRIRYIEKMGTGIAKIRKLMKEAKLPPQFEYETFFMVRFRRPADKKLAWSGKPDVLNDIINEPIKKDWHLNSFTYIRPVFSH